MDKSNSFDWHKIFLLVGLSFLVGLWFGGRVGGSLILSLWLILVAASLAAAAKMIPEERRRLFYWAFLVFAGLGLGFGRVAVSPNYSHELDSYLGRVVSVNAVVADEPDEREAATKLTVKAEGRQAKILVTTDRYPKHEIGQVIKVTGKLSQPKNIFSTSSASFDYRAYLAKDGIYYEFYRPQIEILKEPAGSARHFFSRLRGRLVATMNQVLPEPESSLLGGVLLGVKSGMDQATKKDFQKSGLSHVLVLSGYNITFVATWLLNIFSFLPHLAGGLLGIISLGAFGMLAGGGAVVWRAVLMAFLALYARLSGRLYDTGLALVLTAIVIGLYNPRVVAVDLGFHLSMAALIGIVYVSPVVKEKFFRRIPEKFELREVVSSTVGAQLMTIPLIWHSLGQISLVGFISNPVVLPLVPVAMFVGFWTLLLGLISPALAWPLSFVLSPCLSLILILARHFASWPMGVAVTGGPSPVLAVIFYSVLFTFVFKFYYRKRQSLLLPTNGS